MGISLVRYAGIYDELWSTSKNDWYMSSSDNTFTYSSEDESEFFGVRCLKDATTTATFPKLPKVVIDNVGNSTETSYLKSVTAHVVNQGSSAVTGRYIICTPDSVVYNPLEILVYLLGGQVFTDNVATNCVTKSALEANKTYYIRAYAANSEGWSFSDAVAFTTPAEGLKCPGTPTVSDQNSNSYPTVQIGTQCWMAQNLRSTTYPGGGAISYYNPTSYNNNYGRLYNVASTTRNMTSTGSLQGVCPTGWHVPTSAEFNVLHNYLKSQAAYKCGSGSSAIAKSLASTSGWTASSTTCQVGNDQAGNNASGFNAWPAGVHDGSSANFQGELVAFQTTTDTRYIIRYDRDYMTSWAPSASYYYSVRCLKGATPPSVGTGNVSAKAYNSATVEGNLYTDGINTTFDASSVTQMGICYAPASTTTSPTISNSKKTVTVAEGNFTATLTGLTKGTTYWYRAYATNANGTQYGEAKSFTTSKPATVSIVKSYTNKTNTSITLYANVGAPSSDVTISNRVLLIEEQNSSGSWNYLTSGTVSGSGTGQYSYNFTGLTAGTKYRVYARVNQTLPGYSGTYYAYSYDSDNQGLENGYYYFQLGTKASVSTTGVTYQGDDKTSMYFNLTGNLSNAGTPVITEKGFVYSSSVSNPKLNTSSCYKVTVSGTSTGSFSYSLLRSAINTKYYVKAYAINALDTVYGTVTTFTTHDYPNVYLSDNYSNAYYYNSEVTDTTMRMKGEFQTVSSSATSGGCEACYSQGFVFSTSPMSITDANTTSAGINSSHAPTTFGTVRYTTGGAFTIGQGNTYTVNGTSYTNSPLSSNTKYYVRAWARSAAGYTYSEERVVRTKINCNKNSYSSAARTLHDQDGNTYYTVKIGSQCWMKSNLRATHYDDAIDQWENGVGGFYDGDSSKYTPIAKQTSNVVSTSTAYYYFPNSNSTNASSYGLLYNWIAATKNGSTNYSGGQVRGACPRGWHVPSYSELNTLNTSLNNSSNISTFSPQYAGELVSGSGSPNYALFQTYMYMWSSQDVTTPYYLYLNNTASHGVASSSSVNKGTAMSVRCVQD